MQQDYGTARSLARSSSSVGAFSDNRRRHPAGLELSGHGLTKAGRGLRHQASLDFLSSDFLR